MKTHHEVSFDAPPQAIYELLTNGANFGEVTGQAGKGGGSAGAAFILFNGWLEGRQVELVPNEIISQAWRFQNWEPCVYSMVRFQLKPEGNGTELVLDRIRRGCPRSSTSM